MDYAKESLRLHGEWKGKIEVIATVPANDKESLSLAYTPGVAQPCLEIQKHPEKSYELTRRHNLVAVITDGTAVLGLGDIGPEAGMPVMEGKCVLFKRFADVDAFPLCVKTKDVDEFVQTVYNISGSFGGINLEDIAAPRCFEIERKLKERCDIPVFHDDQHGTAIIAPARHRHHRPGRPHQRPEGGGQEEGGREGGVLRGRFRRHLHHQAAAPGRVPGHHPVRQVRRPVRGQPRDELGPAGDRQGHQPGEEAGQAGRRPT